MKTLRSASDIIDDITAKHGNTVTHRPCQGCGSKDGMEVIPPESALVSLCQTCLHARHGLTVVRMKLADTATGITSEVVLLMTDDQMRALQDTAMVRRVQA